MKMGLRIAPSSLSSHRKDCHVTNVLATLEDSFTLLHNAESEDEFVARGVFPSVKDRLLDNCECDTAENKLPEAALLIVATSDFSHD
jgi:hypothetical protein